MAEVALRQVVEEVRRRRSRPRDRSRHPRQRVRRAGRPLRAAASRTTLRMIAGLEEITSGDICIGGEVVNDLPPKDRDIAMVFQNYALYPHMTAFENMVVRA